MKHYILFFFCFTDPADAQYRQNEVTPVDYLKFKHHSYSEMVAVEYPHIRAPCTTCLLAGWIPQEILGYFPKDKTK